MSTCPSCGSTAVEEDRGTATCTVCGTVLEDSIIVSEVTFTEDSNVVEQFVGAEGRDLIQRMSTNLQLNSGHADAAVKYYKMAAQRKFTAGRSSDHVAASCLYIVCREEKSPHMLLDFADLLKCNCNANEGLTIDPVLFLPRFVLHLRLGEKKHEIGRTAIRIVSRMKRDWLHIGRRPAGICGAALLLAARLHGFSRSQRDVVHAVKVCSSTVRKRLDEFADTPSARLTMDEFLSIDLEGEADPPAFKKSLEERQLALQSTVEECERLAATEEFAALDDSTASSLLLPDTQVIGKRTENDKVENSDIVPFKRPNISANGDKPWEGDNNEDLSDESDDDLDLNLHILNDDEVKVKTEIWTQNNQEYLDQQAQRREEEANAPKKTRKRRQQPRVPVHQHHRAAARERIKAEDKKSSKIDYDSLQNLFGS